MRSVLESAILGFESKNDIYIDQKQLIIMSDLKNTEDQLKDKECQQQSAIIKDNDSYRHQFMMDDGNTVTKLLKENINQVESFDQEYNNPVKSIQNKNQFLKLSMNSLEAKEQKISKRVPAADNTNFQMYGQVVQQEVQKEINILQLRRLDSLEQNYQSLSDLLDDIQSENIDIISNEYENEDFQCTSAKRTYKNGKSSGKFIQNETFQEIKKLKLLNNLEHMEFRIHIDDLINESKSFIKLNQKQNIKKIEDECSKPHELYLTYDGMIRSLNKSS